MDGDYDVLWDERRLSECEAAVSKPKKKSKSSAKSNSESGKANDASPLVFDAPDVLDSDVFTLHTLQPALEKDFDADSGYFMEESANSTSPRKQNFYSSSPPPLSNTDNSSLAASNCRSNECSMSPPSLAVYSQTQANGQFITMGAGLTPDYELPIDAQRVLPTNVTGRENYETPMDASI